MLPNTLRKGGSAAQLTDGRVHLQHGPIDLLIDIDAPAAVRAAAISRALLRFDGLLNELVRFRPVLSRPLPAAAMAQQQQPGGAARTRRSTGARIAARMCAAVESTAIGDVFVTPMAAVAGAIADEVLDAIATPPGLRRAAVNNGGDISVYLADGERYRIALCADPRSGRRVGELIIDTPGRHGVATSGWQGRSRSLGLADAVTVWVEGCEAPSSGGCAAMADAAATLIANAVDCDACDCVTRVPAESLDPDSDLGARAVTTHVTTLPAPLRRAALAAGAAYAQALHEHGQLGACWLHLQGESLIAPDTPASPLDIRLTENR